MRRKARLSSRTLLGLFLGVPENLKKDDFEDLAKTGRLISGTFTVEPEGTVNLGPLYGRVKVVGLTVDEARKAVDTQLKKITNVKLVDDGKVFLELTQF